MHIDVVKMNEWGEKRGLSEWTWFLSTWLLVPDALQAWEFNKLLIYWDIHTGTTVSRVYRGWSKAKRVENALLMSCWCHVDVRGQNGQTGWRNGKATVTQTTTGCHQGLQNITCEPRAPPTLKLCVHAYTRWPLYKAPSTSKAHLIDWLVSVRSVCDCSLPALTWVVMTTGLSGQRLQLDKREIQGDIRFRFWHSVSSWKVQPSNKIDIWSVVTPTLSQGPSLRGASCRTPGAEFQLLNVWWQQVTFSVAAAHWIEINCRPTVWGPLAAPKVIFPGMAFSGAFSAPVLPWNKAYLSVKA